LEAEYVAAIGRLTSETMDSMWTTAPPPDFASAGANARVRASGPKSFTSISCLAPVRSGAELEPSKAA
jgi:hypothetical protein